ncbi:hypothetical protein BJ508DRAFT_308080 [Ascobolus immersus RN42]|uniref:Uncharacterized protein n=1 Tax=Ascobolus immersus RN42 TaxID=1160509 RepID=A0A3N4I6N3_ASCIM|nr:hypothetical protein BJ508DRAFT_308080 [Ascobolus immersus RN42]
MQSYRLNRSEYVDQFHCMDLVPKALSSAPDVYPRCFYSFEDHNNDTSACRAYIKCILPTKEDPALFSLDFDGPSSYPLYLFGPSSPDAAAVIGFSIVAPGNSATGGSRITARALIKDDATDLVGKRAVALLRGLLSSGHAMDFTVTRWDRDVGFSVKTGYNVVRAVGSFRCLACPCGVLDANATGMQMEEFDEMSDEIAYANSGTTGHFGGFVSDKLDGVGIAGDGDELEDVEYEGESVHKPPPSKRRKTQV